MTNSTSNPNYKIREANDQDLDAIMELENACFGNDAWDSDSPRSSTAKATLWLPTTPTI